MADYIEFELSGRKCRLNREDSHDIQRWFVKSGRRMLKKPYWRKASISTNSEGYYHFRLGNRLYKHHRVVYFAHNPEWNINDCSKNNHIDHEDGNRTNNHINNLRVVTQAENNQNIIAKGYSYHKRDKIWEAYIALNGKQMHLGRFLTEEEANQARAEGVRKYHPFARQS